MKKSKLLIAAPFVAATMTTVLPIAITSCSHKKQENITLLGEFANNVDLKNITESFEIGKPYACILSVKEDKIGEEFLPSTLKEVKSGGVLLHSADEETTNDEENCYRYIPVENNTKAYFIIENLLGSVSIESDTAQFTSIVAESIDPTGTPVVEYEVGDTPNKNSRLAVSALLSNGEYFIVDDYEIHLTGHDSGKPFDETQSTLSEGYVVVNDVKSNTFQWKVIAKTAAYLTEQYGETSTTTKYETFESAIDGYDGKRTNGRDYTIKVVPGEYEIDLDKSYPYVIREMSNSNLTIRPYFFAGGKIPEEECIVKITPKHIVSTTQTKRYSLCLDTPSGSSVGSSSMNFINIQFNPEKDTSQQGTEDFAHVSIQNGVNNVNFYGCNFIGDKTDTFKATAVATHQYHEETGTAQATFVKFDHCTGRYMESLFNGRMTHSDSASSDNPDFVISNCNLYDFDKLFNIQSIGDTALVGSVTSTTTDFAWSGSRAEEHSINSGMTLDGVSNFTFKDSTFKQLTSASSASNGLIYVTTLADKHGNLSFKNCSVEKISEAQYYFHDIWNGSDVDGAEWSIAWDDQSGKAWGKQSGEHSIYWDRH